MDTSHIAALQGKKAPTAPTVGTRCNPCQFPPVAKKEPCCNNCQLSVQEEEVGCWTELESAQWDTKAANPTEWDLDPGSRGDPCYDTADPKRGTSKSCPTVLNKDVWGRGYTPPSCVSCIELHELGFNVKVVWVAFSFQLEVKIEEVLSEPICRLGSN